MKRKVMLLGILLSMVGFVVGCSAKLNTKQEKAYHMIPISEIQMEAKQMNYEFGNLDFSDAAITIPAVDKITSITFPVSTDSLEKQIKKFDSNIRKFKKINKKKDLTKYEKMMYWDEELNDRIVVPFNKATDEQLSKIQYLSYNDGSYSELVVFSNYMLEMGDYKLPTALTGDKTDYSDNAYGYRGIDIGTLVKSFQLPEDDISNVTYPLVDGEMKLSDAIEYTEKHIKEDYYFVGSKLLDYHVCEAEVRRLDENIYYYQFKIQPSYQGINFNKDGGIALEEEEDNPLAAANFGTAHKASMFQKNSLGFIWSSCHSYESCQPQKEYTEFISLKDACSILSEYLSGKQVFQIASVEMLYQTEFQYESDEKREYGYIQSVYCHPAYHFELADPTVLGYNNMYFDVDALTGEIITSVS